MTAETSGTSTYDAVVLGLGSGGEHVAEHLARRGWRVAGVESGLVGGERPYLACVPSKALLARAGEVRRGDPSREARRAAWPDAVTRRREAAEHLDDSGSVATLHEAGVVLVRGRGEARPDGEVHVTSPDGARQVLRWTRALVVGTGGSPTLPPVDGLDDVPTSCLGGCSCWVAGRSGVPRRRHRAVRPAAGRGGRRPARRRGRGRTAGGLLGR